MANSIDKSKIIEAINQTDDDRILFAIERLLQIDDMEDIPEWHKTILNQRIKEVEEGKAVFYNWEDVKGEIFPDKK